MDRTRNFVSFKTNFVLKDILYSTKNKNKAFFVKSTAILLKHVNKYTTRIVKNKVQYSNFLVNF